MAAAEGGNLGLVTNYNSTVYGNARFVAVEFDTFNNSYEQPAQAGDHIGIDVGSIEKSINTTRLRFSPNGTMKASITFDNISWMLVASVEFTEPPDSRYAPYRSVRNFLQIRGPCSRRRRWRLDFLQPPAEPSSCIRYCHGLSTLLLLLP
uniref:Legume lectin domain-containing protein n=1 Tax=Oryza rufipogon TaxID=4529 RepID=A0A0E0P4Q9_ORYRU